MLAGDGILQLVLQQLARRGEPQESSRCGGKRMLEADDVAQEAQIITQLPKTTALSAASLSTPASHRSQFSPPQSPQPCSNSPTFLPPHSAYTAGSRLAGLTKTQTEAAQDPVLPFNFWLHC